MKKHNTNVLVSIITPMYNSATYIRDTLDSVVSQTYENWEIIVVDDFSTDEGRAIVEEYCQLDKRINLISLAEKSPDGAISVRNEGIKASRGRFIAFLDSDDIWDANKLENQVDFMLNNQIAFSYADYRVCNEENTKILSIYRAPKKVSYSDLCKSNSIGCLVAMYDASILGKIYNENSPKREDLATWLKILKKVDYAYNVGQVLATYRLRKASVSSKKRKLIKYQWYMYRKVENIGLLKSIFYLIATIVNKIFKY